MTGRSRIPAGAELTPPASETDRPRPDDLPHRAHFGTVGRLGGGHPHVLPRRLRGLERSDDFISCYPEGNFGEKGFVDSFEESGSNGWATYIEEISVENPGLTVGLLVSCTAWTLLVGRGPLERLTGWGAGRLVDSRQHGAAARL